MNRMSQNIPPILPNNHIFVNGISFGVTLLFIPNKVATLASFLLYLLMGMFSSARLKRNMSAYGRISWFAPPCNFLNVSPRKATVVEVINPIAYVQYIAQPLISSLLLSVHCLGQEIAQIFSIVRTSVSGLLRFPTLRSAARHLGRKLPTNKTTTPKDGFSQTLFAEQWFVRTDLNSALQTRFD